jgi:hypothetical protein
MDGVYAAFIMTERVAISEPAMLLGRRIKRAGNLLSTHSQVLGLFAVAASLRAPEVIMNQSRRSTSVNILFQYTADLVNRIH